MTDTSTTTASASSDPQAATMRGVIPYLNLAGQAGAAADFYARAFGAVDLGRMPDPEKPGRFMHVQIEINGGALMMTDHQGDGEPQRCRLESAHLQLVVADGEHWWNRAVAAGCRVLAPYEPQFWGDTWGLVEDPFGIRWGILQSGPNATP